MRGSLPDLMPRLEFHALPNEDAEYNCVVQLLKWP
jgi:hypothetical protein